MKYPIMILLSAVCFLFGCGRHSVSQEREDNQKHAQENVEKFKQIFAQLDAAVQVGMPLTNAITILQVPPRIYTNDNGTVEAHFTYMPSMLDHATYRMLTNGFVLWASNGIVVRKDYGYSSSFNQ